MNVIAGLGSSERCHAKSSIPTICRCFYGNVL